MKNCGKCGRINIRESEKYCPDCGSREIELNQIAGSDGNGGTTTQNADVPKGARIAAFGVDFVGLFALSLLSNIPGLGLLAALAALLYQLLRDFRGASVGKVFFHLVVLDRSSGDKASPRQCIIRNVIFIAPFFAMFIPGLGFIAGGPVILLIYFVEFLLLLSTGHRLGDRMAGTVVAKRS